MQEKRCFGKVEPANGTIKHQKRSRNRQVEGADRKIQTNRLTGPDIDKVIG